MNAITKVSVPNKRIIRSCEGRSGREEMGERGGAGRTEREGLGERTNWLTDVPSVFLILRTG